MIKSVFIISYKMTDCNKQSNEDIVKELYRVMFRHDIAALEHVEPLARLLMDNPDEGIGRIVSTYNEGLNSAYTD